MVSPYLTPAAIETAIHALSHLLRLAPNDDQLPTNPDVKAALTQAIRDALDTSNLGFNKEAEALLSDIALSIKRLRLSVDRCTDLTTDLLKRLNYQPTPKGNASDALSN